MPRGSARRRSPRGATRSSGSRPSRRPAARNRSSAGNDAGLEQKERVRRFLDELVREREAVEAVEKDRRIVERLAAVLNDFGVHGDERKANADYAAAFRAYGVDLDSLDPVGRRHGCWRRARPPRNWPAPSISGRSCAAGGCCTTRRAPIGWSRWRRAADPDPWRNRLRDTVGRMEGGPARRLEVLERLAATADVEHLPVTSVTRLATSLAIFGTTRHGDRPAPAGTGLASRRLLGERRPGSRVDGLGSSRGGGPLLRRRRGRQAPEPPGPGRPGQGAPAERPARRGRRPVSPVDPASARGPALARRARFGAARAGRVVRGPRRILRGETAEAEGLDGPRPDRAGLLGSRRLGRRHPGAAARPSACSPRWAWRTRRSPTPCNRPVGSERRWPNSARPCGSIPAILRVASLPRPGADRGGRAARGARSVGPDRAGAAAGPLHHARACWHRERRGSSPSNRGSPP